MNYFEIAKNDCDEINNNIFKINNRSFFNSIVERGKDYYKQGKVENLIKIDEDTYSANVKGTELYNVKVKMMGKINVDGECSCPFNVADEGYINPKLCKHIYATYIAVCELENKEYLNRVKKEYIEKYYSLYNEIIEKIEGLKLKLKDKKTFNKCKEEFTQLYETTQDTFSKNELNPQMILDLLYNFINKSAEILDLLEKINTSYKKELMENEYDNGKTENSKPKEPFIVKFLNFCVAVVEGIFGLTSYNDSEEDNDFERENEDEYEYEDENANDSETENVFSYGDTVMVKYNGKVGVIVDVSGNYYTLKLKDEFENDYYASYYENELERYD